MSAQPIPAGFHSVTPYLTIRDAAAALDFYQRAFGATVRFRMPMPDGKVAHAEIQIGDSIVMLSDEFPEMGCTSPQTLGGSPVTLYVYVDDVDTFFPKAVAAGAKEIKPVQDQFYGDRSGHLEDPYGHQWWIATHKEDVAPEELEKRMKAMGG